MHPVPYAPDLPAARVDQSLKRSLAALENARRCAVLWFGEIMRRGLYRDLGYASINQYARAELGFSRSRTGDFVQLARKLDKLPRVRAAVASGELGYTKAREVVKVATARTEARWLEAARRPRRELVREVKRVRRAARVPAGQGELLPAGTVVAPRELPVTHTVTLTPEQEARRAALVERLHKLGRAPGDRAELLLEALAALVEQAEDARAAGPGRAAESADERAPRGAPPVQIHVHERDGELVVPTEQGDRALGAADAARLRCDAAISRPGHRNTTTIPPRVRRQVLARDGHRCRAPGCGRTRFLEVHHKRPRRQGGTHDPENLVTLCAACHRWHHQRC